MRKKDYQDILLEHGLSTSGTIKTLKSRIQGMILSPVNENNLNSTQQEHVDDIAHAATGTPFVHSGRSTHSTVRHDETVAIPKVLRPNIYRNTQDGVRYNSTNTNVPPYTEHSHQTHTTAEIHSQHATSPRPRRPQREIQRSQQRNVNRKRAVIFHQVNYRSS